MPAIKGKDRPAGLKISWNVIFVSSNSYVLIYTGVQAVFSSYKHSA